MRDSPRTYKIVSHLIIEHKSGKEHHEIKIETYRKNNNSIIIDENHSISLNDEDDDEIEPLVMFLSEIRRMSNDAGAYVILPFNSYLKKRGAIIQAIDTISSSDQADLVAGILSKIKGNPEVLQAIVKHISEDQQTSKEAVAVLNLARYSKAVEELERLIQVDAGEGEFQHLLSQNEWMFGSEYSKLLFKRDWVRSERQDFMVRRTADNYLEVIEIKTPLGGASLFIEDTSHCDGTFYPRSELSKVLGQVMKYLEDLDADEHRIKATDKEDVSKIRAKVIIGRDGNEEQIRMLRRFNGHLHRIEILTFDQLLKIAKQVLSFQELVIASSEVGSL